MRYNRDNDEETIVFHNIFIFLFLRIFITKIMHTILETIFQYNQTTFSLFFHIIARYKVFPLSNLVNFASESINLSFVGFERWKQTRNPREIEGLQIGSRGRSWLPLWTVSPRKT